MGADVRIVEIAEGALAGKDLLPVRCFGTEAISELFSFSLVMLHTGSAPLDTHDLIGKSTTIRLNSMIPNSTERLVHGCISQISCDGAKKRYTMKIVPELWKAGLVTKARTHVYKQASADEVVIALLKEMDGDIKVRNLAKCDLKYNYFDIQYNVSDLDYLYRVLSAYGLSFYFEHAMGAHTLVLFNSISGLSIRKSPLVFDPTEFIMNVESITGWDEKVSAFSAGATATDFDMNNSTLKSEEFMAQHPMPELTSVKWNLYAQGVISGSDSSTRSYALVDERSQAKIYHQRECAAHHIINFESNASALFPGQKIALEGATPSSEQEFVILSVSHQAESSLDTGSDYSCILSVMPKNSEIPSREEDARPIFTQLLARVKNSQYRGAKRPDLATVTVVFPWDEQKESFWIPVSQAFGGDGSSGALFLPQVDDTVLVTFINGDTRRPVVSGIVYNGKNKTPPFDNDNTEGLRMGIKVPSGSEWSISEMPGEEEVYWRSSGDMKVIVDRDEVGEVMNDQSLSVGNNRTVSVNGDQKTEVQGNALLDVEGASEVMAGQKIELSVGPNTLTIDTGKIELKGPTSSVVVDASGITVTSNGMINIDGIQVTAKSKASTEVSSTGMTQVKGGVVMIN
ncbi:type VI secretion system tip protein TssI/VgrG [Marinobacter sp. chi1]|uniref:Type VI secretion system tip protein TssI/VgrG n=1 Tax=Marinobacter suaedae TaxID=3057675 RepID=A0ABT8VW32_9GAMM|nr:type VI secretion system tip protein TssI/VgrG [Marinobacter sp. chi1]MDO3720191.1 type VI secretion system tip protein TssI/VgrG [Marinobacter sp. chi1]